MTYRSSFRLYTFLPKPSLSVRLGWVTLLLHKHVTIVQRMGKPIEDIRGPERGDRSSIQNSLQKSSSFFGSGQTPPSVFQNPPLSTFQENDKLEIKEIDSEIKTNPFLMRYAHHATGGENFGRLPGGRRQNSGGRKSLWTVAGLVLLAALFSLSYVFAHATVLVVPKVYTVALDDVFEARYQSESGVSYEKMSVENSETETVTSSGSTTGDVAATGTVRLYNEYSTNKQSLLINTRLEAPDGKIYMTDVATTIPGYIKAGNEIVPGSVEVGIHAEKGGEEYNKEPTDFIIFGWKSDKVKSQKFYARSTTPIAGGSSGLVYTISEEEYNAKITALEETVRQKVRNQIYAEVPEGYFTFDDAIMIEEKERTYARSSTDVSVPVSLTLKATALIFPKDLFVLQLRKQKDADIVVSEQTVLTLPNTDGATITLTPESKKSDATSVSFHVLGDVPLEGTYDRDSLLAELLGKKTKQIPDILAGNDAIESIQVKMRPLWKQSFPKNPTDIEIVTSHKE